VCDHQQQIDDCGMTNEAESSPVAAGYDAVYAALPNSPTFRRIWREHACGADFPTGYDHISFVTLNELRFMLAELHLQPGGTLADLACGMGGPGLWIAQQAQARLVGVDISAVAVQRATERASAVGYAENATFVRGTFADTTLSTESVNAAMSIDALQYAPDKQAALREIARILVPGGVFVFACFEYVSERVAGLPVFGDDPVSDYCDILTNAGFDVVKYEETEGWWERVSRTYRAVLDATAALTSEMGERVVQTLAGEMQLTLQLQPYRRRVFVSARKRTAGT
jgi:ubiquinone/menaquinone biosynthesis C-methylase UbiE